LKLQGGLAIFSVCSATCVIGALNAFLFFTPIPLDKKLSFVPVYSTLSVMPFLGTLFLSLAESEE